MVLIFILIYFKWRDTENQQYNVDAIRNTTLYKQIIKCPRGVRLMGTTAQHNFSRVVQNIEVEELKKMANYGF